MPKTENDYRQEIVELGLRLHQQGFVAATAGNLSVRLDEQRMLTTPTNSSKARLRPQDLIIVDRRGNKIAGERVPSSELPMHLLIYQLRPEVGGIVHAHPPTATGFAAAGMALDEALVAETVVTLGSVPLARYGTPGSQQLNEALRDLIPGHHAILMANHGVVTYGEDLLQAYYHMESVEHLARVSLVTVLLGKQSKLTHQDVEKLMELRTRRA